MFGYTAAEVPGRSLEEFLSSDNDAERHQLQETMLAAVLKDGHYRSSLRCQSKAQKDFAAELTLTLLRDVGSAPAGIVAIFSVAEKSIGRTVSSKAEAEEDEAARTVSRKLDGVELILASPVMNRFMRMVDRVAGHTESVLVTGETGTGKELIARTIHQSSHRRSRPWVDIN